MRWMTWTWILSFFVALAILPPSAFGREDTQPAPAQAPLQLATGSGPSIEFQLGADGMHGFGVEHAEFVGGVNATLSYPVLDWLWVGLRPALHYVMHDDQVAYDATWLHADVHVQINLLDDPLRLYGLLAGGYAMAQDTDLYDGVAHGYSALLGFGVAWRPEESHVGLFAELGFRYGAASRDRMQLATDANGDFIYDEPTLTWQTEEVGQTYKLMAFTCNLGVTFSP